MKKQLMNTIKASLCLVGALFLSACQPSAPTLATEQSPSAQQLPEPSQVQDVVKTVEPTYNCTLSAATYQSIRELLASGNGSANSLGLDRQTPTYLLVREALDGTPAQVSFYERKRLDHCLSTR